MKKGIAVITAVFVLTAAGLALAQMNDKAKEIMGEKAPMKEEQKGTGMMEGKGGMMGKGMMGGGMMKMMMGMMRQMHDKASVTATSDGGALVVSGGKLIKYDNQLNVVKEVDLPKSEMGMMGRGMKDNDADDDDKGADKPAEDHEAHHPQQ